jgi:hypothetical protein
MDLRSFRRQGEHGILETPELFFQDLHRIGVIQDIANFCIECVRHFILLSLMGLRHGLFHQHIDYTANLRKELQPLCVRVVVAGADASVHVI